jgi:hypothetical protein
MFLKISNWWVSGGKDMLVKKILVAIFVALLFALSTISVASATGNGEHEKKDHKIGICHATGSKTNPYVFIVVDKHAADAHSRHQDGRDVIGAKSQDECPKTKKETGHTSSTRTTATNQAVESAKVNETVAEIPKTGAAGLVSALLGVSTLGYTTAAYIRSRKNV